MSKAIIMIMEVFNRSGINDIRYIDIHGEGRNKSISVTFWAYGEKRCIVAYYMDDVEESMYYVRDCFGRHLYDLVSEYDVRSRCCIEK